MNFGLHEFCMSCLGLAALPLFFLAPGYVAASLTELLSFSRQSWVERLLWACALSVPLALVLAVHPGLGLTPRVTTSLFVALSLAAMALAVRDARRSNPKFEWDRSASMVAIAAACLVPYVLLSAVPIATHGRIYESSLWQDWNVRIQLVNAAIRGGNTPANPMYAAAGQPSPLHYYYFWYVLCARMHDLVPVSARAILTASCVGVGLSLLALLLLAIKYLSPSPIAVRRQSVAGLLAACMLGLDLVAFILMLPLGRIYSDLQFWLDERSPGFLSLVLWSPHHVAGLVCCSLGVLLFLQARDLPVRRKAVHAVLAALCFAASAGTSTFITLLFASACLCICLEAVRRRSWSLPAMMLGAAVLAGIIVLPFFHHVLSVPSGSVMVAGPPPSGTPEQQLASASKASAPPLVPNIRYRNQAVGLLWFTMTKLDRNLKHLPAATDPGYNKIRWTLRTFRVPYMAVLFVFDLGFFLFILVRQIRKDLLSPGPMPRRALDLWLLFLGIAVPGCFLSSGTLQGNNDLGRHAGFCLRLVFVVWSAPAIAEFLDRWRQARRAGAHMPWTAATRWAVAFAVIGLLGQVLQIALVRLRFVLTDAGRVPRVIVEERIPHPAFRFGQAERAIAAATALTPPTGIVQWNPHSRMRNVYLLYTDRQAAASDDGCNVPFGGDLKTCLLMSRDLIQLFGGMGVRYQGAQKIFDGSYLHLDPEAITPANFARICAIYRINTVIASYSDPAWRDRQSWIWQLRPAFANSTARVFPCPQQSSLAAPQPLGTSEGNLVVH